MKDVICHSSRMVGSDINLSFASQESFILSIDHDALTANLHQAMVSIYWGGLVTGNTMAAFDNVT